MTSRPRSVVHGVRYGKLLLAVSLSVLPAGIYGQTTTPVAGRYPSVVEATGQPVAGSVVSAADGHPIANATLVLTREQQRQSGRRQGRPGSQGETAQTNAGGRYSFPSEAAGRYSLQASAPGYLSMLYLEHEGYSSAIVTGAGVSTANLRFALVPEATLRGRVLDETGEPVHATISLYRDAGEDGGTNAAAGESSPRFRHADTGQTDDDGRYDFTSLRPGRYYVSASATPWYAVHARTMQNEDRLPYRTSIDPALDVAYPVTFYPHATSEDGAVPIMLKPGSSAVANLLMQAEHAVTLTVQMPSQDGSGRGGIPAFPALFHTVFGSDQAAGSQMSGRVGDTVELSGIAPGQYTLRSFGRAGSGGSGTPVNVSGGSQSLVLSATGADTTGVVEMTLRSLAGTALPDSVQVRLQRVGPTRGGQQLLDPAKVDGGVAQFTDVPSGDYRVRVSDNEASWNVSRLRVRGEAKSSMLLHVGSGTLQAELIASQYAPEVDGTVHAGDGTPHAGSLVVLVPAGADTSVDLYRADQSDLDGGFHFQNVLPGNYLLVAIDNDWKLNWHNAAALMAYLPHALPVTVPGSGPRVLALPEAAIAQQK